MVDCTNCWCNINPRAVQKAKRTSRTKWNWKSLDLEIPPVSLNLPQKNGVYANSCVVFHELFTGCLGLGSSHSGHKSWHLQIKHPEQKLVLSGSDTPNGSILLGYVMGFAGTTFQIKHPEASPPWVGSIPRGKSLKKMRGKNPQFGPCLILNSPYVRWWNPHTTKVISTTKARNRTNVGGPR